MIDFVYLKVLHKLESSFIFRLIKTLEDKIYFGRREYHSQNFVVFPPIECKNYGSALFRLKPAVYYEISKAGVSVDKISLHLSLSESDYLVENIRNGYDYDVALDYLSFELSDEVGVLSFGIILDGIMDFKNLPKPVYLMKKKCVLFSECGHISLCLTRNSTYKCPICGKISNKIFKIEFEEGN